MCIGRVGHPLAERVEENIRRESRREHHAAPLEEGVLRAVAAEANATEARKSEVEGQQKDAESEEQIVPAELLAEKAPDGIQGSAGSLRCGEKGQAECQNQQKGQ